jgi:gamma-glutamyltranspeptidase/glutathione hydrolase
MHPHLALQRNRAGLVQRFPNAMSLRFIRSCVLAAFAALAALAGSGAHALDPAPERATGRTEKVAMASRRFMVVAANPLAADAGYRTLAAGGSAVDAAIAVQLVLTLVEPQSSGIGGGAFMLVHDARHNRLLAYDGRETAPAAATPERFLDANGRPMEFREAVVGGRSVGVPGVVALLEAAHRRHGKLPWARLFEPAIALSKQGFVVSPRLHALLAAEGTMRQPRARDYFFDADGRPLAVGAIRANPAFAATLERIATGGARAFYEGEIARDIVAAVYAAPTNPGDMTLSDLAGYRVKLREPVCGPYRAYRVCGVPPPSSGGIAVLQMLGILAPFDVGAMGADTFWSVHFMSEAGRLAYADRDQYVADPEFVAVPGGLLDPAYLRERSSLISTARSLGRASAGNPAQQRGKASGTHAAIELPATSHISIVDAEGNAVSMTTSIESAFGSGLMTEGGFLLNNELTDFSFLPSENGQPVANRIEAGKRPRSTMAPTIVYDRGGRVYMVVGAPGGSAIVNYVVKTLLGVIDWKLDPQAAIALPNAGSRNGPTELEAGTAAATLAPKLEAIGHQTWVQPESSGVHAIVRTRDGWIGGADPRREGVVRGD